MSSGSPRPLLKFPIDLRAFILYHEHQHISAEKSYKNYKKLCEAMGNEAISFEEYENWLKEYLKEDERDRSIPDIRGCILSDVINGKPAEKSIDDLCDAFKRHKIDKEDHDYWYKRFDSGHLFSRVTFSDFPEDVLAEIVERCDIKSYLNLRSVSRALLTVIDQLAPPYTDIEVHSEDSRMNVIVDSVHMADWDYHYSNLPKETFKRKMPGSLTVLSRNQKLRLKSFGFYTYSGSPETYTKTVINLLNSWNRKIHVEYCSIGVDSKEELIGILQCFKPGTLDKMCIFGRYGQFDINEIVEMDQWKQAKHLVLVETNLPSTDHLLHFSTVELHDHSIPLEDVVELCKSIPIWTNFEHIKIGTCDALDFETIKKELNLQPTAYPRIFSIPNTNLVIQYERSWYAHLLEITKK